MKATELTASDKIRLLATQGMGWKIVMLADEDRAEGVYPRLEEQFADSWWFMVGEHDGKRWNPFTSLDTVAEIEARLTDKQWWKYEEQLFRWWVADVDREWGRFLLTASAAQRSEALVEVLGA